MKILIAGDSFSTINSTTGDSWINLLQQSYEIKNVSQAGVGEYKIFKQIRSENLSRYDLIIVSHTSPSRVHTYSHPIHKEGFHKNCDLIFADIENKIDLGNPGLKSAKGWFKYHYDDDYQIDIYKLIREKINSLIEIPYISISHIKMPKNITKEKEFLDFSDLWEHHRGEINHYTAEGNLIIYNTLKEKISKLL